MPPSEPVAYISYAWGDDESPAGVEREEIVNDLCRSFADAGIIIGRDKNEVKIGDSIEAFGTRIAKAPVILAVISHRSLRSEWCMLYELFAAYTRRGSNSEEFADNVVALVLDDAIPDLKKRKGLIAHWRTWCSDLEDELRDADPEKEESLESQRVLVNSQRMIKSLPDMLLALRRIAMPRGSASIRRDDFSDIIEYVQGKLAGAEQEIPDPPPLDLDGLRLQLDKLARQYAAISPAQLHECWYGAIQATWPRQDPAILFPRLSSQPLLEWAVLQGSLTDPGQWSRLQMERFELLFEHFVTRLELAVTSAFVEKPASLPPSLAVLITPTGDKSPEGVPAYRCKAVLCIPLNVGGLHYEQVLPHADHLFCFAPHKDRPDWPHPGAVLGQLWQAAQARLVEQGQIHREPFLDLFLPRGLLDQSWSGLELVDDTGESSSMKTTFYRLRSIDRWTVPKFLGHKEHFDRKHRAIKAGSGYWKLFAEGFDSAELHSDLSLSRSSSNSETVAILQLGSMGADQRDRDSFYKSALESSAPLVLWLHHTLEDQPTKARQQQITRLVKFLNLTKPPKGRNHSQRVEGNLLDLPTRKQGLPSSLVVLIDDCLEMDAERPASPRLFSVAEQAPSLGYSSG